MKKLNQVIMLLLVVAFGFSSCSKDDGGTSIEGKWENYRQGTSSNGSELLTNYQHQGSCTNDYIELINGGVIKKVVHSIGQNGCQNTTSTGAWSRNGNQVTITYGSQTSEYEILILDGSTLKVRTPSTQQAGTFIVEIYKRP